MTLPASSTTDRRARLERWTALAACLPAAALAAPVIGPLALDPYPHLAGSGWIAVLALPAAALAARRVRATAGLALLVLVALAGLASARLGDPTDAVELRRAGVHVAAALALFAAGSTLGASGRATLARGLVAVALLALAGALAHRDLALAGALGNTGALSQAALPGAVAGLVLLVARGAAGPATRAAGLIAFLGFAAHAARAPVLLGILAAGGALLFAAVLGARVASGRAQLALCAGAALLLIALIALRAEASPARDPGAGGSAGGVLAGDVGGVGVRLALWRRVPALLRDHPLLGFGPGQTQAAFPPYRDPAEIAASAHQSCEDHATEIDHLHSDPLEGLAELGLLGGLPWLLFLGLGALSALAGLRADEPARVALGAGALALCANALAHSPLGFHPASAALGFALLGALQAPAARTGRIAPAALALAPLLVALVPALALIRHGRELTRAVRGRAEAARAAEQNQKDRAVEGALEWKRHERALAALPRSVPALFLRAEWLRIQGEDPTPELERILALRPHDARAHQELALARLVGAGDVAAARAHWQAVLALDPGHPKVLRNLASLELDHGDPVAAEAYFDALERSGCLAADWIEDTAARLMLEGRGELGVATLARAGARWREADGRPLRADALVERSNQLEAEGREELAGALESAAHQVWAREHAMQGSFGNAVRSYRQALRPTHARHAGGAVLLRLELAAALERRGDHEGAREEVLGLDLDAAVVRYLPEWAREALGGLR